MKCPVCNIEMAISKSYYEALNDDTPEKKTVINLVQDFKCRNKNCSNYNSTVYSERTKVN